MVAENKKVKNTDKKRNKQCPVFFLPRDAMHKRGLCRHAVFIRLSVTFMDSVKTNKHIFKIFSSSCSQTIIVLPHQTSWQYSDRDPPNRSVECRWGRHKSWSSAI